MTESWQRPPSTIHAGWRYTINVEKHFIEDAADAQVPGIAAAIVEELKGARDYAGADAAGEGLRELEEEFGDAESIREFDFILNELYDWGDRFRVIIK